MHKKPLELQKQKRNKKYFLYERDKRLVLLTKLVIFSLKKKV
uniref:Uncharacterized protein n=1 Tax=Brassica oleracea TaxID=3712 RepID=A0A3P6C383_BRAOL|nr:unnamed protein product [Brassica oleracea]